MTRALLTVLLLAGVGRAQGLPDLALDLDTLGRGIRQQLVFVGPEACTLQPADLCVGGAGVRNVLRFNVIANNVGTADLVMGDPAAQLDERLPDGTAKWVWSECHGHYHFQTFARYELRRRGETAPLLEGQKRSFCVEDTVPFAADAPPPQYCCNPATCAEVAGVHGIQGLTVGWGDFYPAILDCQWIDVTEGPDGAPLPPGDYDLCVFLNTAGFLPDTDRTNDTGCVPVALAAPTAPAPRVRLRAPRGRPKVRVGRRLRIAWRKKVPGRFRYQEIAFSPDGGATWQHVAGAIPERHSH
jgi:hypothetical protein